MRNPFESFSSSWRMFYSLFIFFFSIISCRRPRRFDRATVCLTIPDEESASTITVRVTRVMLNPFDVILDVATRMLGLK